MHPPKMLSEATKGGTEIEDTSESRALRVARALLEADHRQRGAIGEGQGTAGGEEGEKTEKGFNLLKEGKTTDL